jgi:uncharacterized protein YqjF (DUF2071 family)/uncharacterized membrane protein
MPAIPVIFPFPLEVIYITGVLEIILAFGLLWKKTQNLSAKFTALYFILLLPIHFYVSIEGIEIFGINNQILLWSRTLLQFVLIFWALSLQTTGWIIEQEWKHVLFIHYQVDPELLAHQVPFNLDLYNGKAILSVVPFLMQGIRFPFLPAIPKISRLWELNIRTYVEVNGVKGVYFFTLETDSKIGKLIAKNFFHLPYRFSKIKAAVDEINYHFDHHRDELNFKLEAQIGKSIPADEFTIWATERYSLFTEHKGRIFQGIVSHKPWEHRNVKINFLNNNFSKMVVEKDIQQCGVSYSKYLKVRFRPFQEVSCKVTKR